MADSTVLNLALERNTGENIKVKHFYTPNRAWPLCKDRVGRFEYADKPELVTCKACMKKQHPKRARVSHEVSP